MPTIVIPLLLPLIAIFMLNNFGGAVANSQYYIILCL